VKVQFCQRQRTNAKKHAKEPTQHTAHSITTRQLRKTLAPQAKAHTAVAAGLLSAPKGQQGSGPAGCTSLLKLQQVGAAGNTAAENTLLLLLLTSEWAES
jgi:hypothetical protein